MLFKIGEKVSFLNETGSAIVVRIVDHQSIEVEEETGFSRVCDTSELVKIQGDPTSAIEHVDLSQFKPDDEETIKKAELAKKVTKHQSRWEIDLHTHELMESEVGMTVSDLLRYQLNCFRSFFNEAQKNYVRKFVVIHGVGQGVLKHEVRSYLDKQDHVEYFDADFQEYGKGATEVRVYYN